MQYFCSYGDQSGQSGAGKMGINETVFIIGYTLYEDWIMMQNWNHILSFPEVVSNQTSNVNEVKIDHALNDGTPSIVWSMSRPSAFLPTTSQS